MASTIVKGDVSKSTKDRIMPLQCDSVSKKSDNEMSTNEQTSGYKFTVDSGANAHMSHSLNIMTYVKPINTTI